MAVSPRLKSGQSDRVSPGIQETAEGGRVGTKELTNYLSAWVREVRRGTRVVVADRGAVIAELRDKGPLPVSSVRLPEGAAEQLLDGEREDRSR
jgi:antitoxin (DNA-binding transcriptional repressor) of toxin-antitoxin stability system